MSTRQVTNSATRGPGMGSPRQLPSLLRRSRPPRQAPPPASWQEPAGPRPGTARDGGSQTDQAAMVDGGGGGGSPRMEDRVVRARGGQLCHLLNDIKHSLLSSLYPLFKAKLRTRLRADRPPDDGVPGHRLAAAAAWSASPPTAGRCPTTCRSAWAWAEKLLALQLVEAFVINFITEESPGRFHFRPHTNSSANEALAAEVDFVGRFERLSRISRSSAPPCRSTGPAVAQPRQVAARGIPIRLHAGDGRRGRDRLRPRDRALRLRLQPGAGTAERKAWRARRCHGGPGRCRLPRACWSPPKPSACFARTIRCFSPPPRRCSSPACSPLSITPRSVQAAASARPPASSLLALAVTAIEVSLIASVMLAPRPARPASPATPSSPR